MLAVLCLAVCSRGGQKSFGDNSWRRSSSNLEKKDLDGWTQFLTKKGLITSSCLRLISKSTFRRPFLSEDGFGRAKSSARRCALRAAIGYSAAIGREYPRSSSRTADTRCWDCCDLCRGCLCLHVLRSEWGSSRWSSSLCGHRQDRVYIRTCGVYSSTYWSGPVPPVRIAALHLLAALYFPPGDY